MTEQEIEAERLLFLLTFSEKLSYLFIETGKEVQEMIKDFYRKKGQKYTVILSQHERQLIGRCFVKCYENNPKFSYFDCLEFFDSIDYLDLDDIYNLIFKIRMLSVDDRKRLMEVHKKAIESSKKSYKKKPKEYYREYYRQKRLNRTPEEIEKIRKRDRERYRKKMAKQGKTEIRPYGKYRKEAGKG